ncbi:hypothetical protein Hanom_Chr07g00596781 [Helianthus anomalus]
MVPNLAPGLSANDHHSVHCPYRQGLTRFRAGTRGRGWFFQSRKDEKTHLVYENECFRQHKACGNHCG